MTDRENRYAERFTFEIVKHFKRLDEDKLNDLNLEFNLVSWRGLTPRYDIRHWNTKHDKLTKGISLTEEQARMVYESLREHFGEVDNKFHTVVIYKNISVEEVARRLSNYTYAKNLQATKELMELFDEIVDRLNNKVVRRTLSTSEDYVKMYSDNFYTYHTWEELVKSELEQGIDGLTEEECREQLNKTIWQLPCGWYVQYV